MSSSANTPLPAIVALSAIGAFGFAAVTPILPDLAVIYHVSNARIALVQTVPAIPGILLAPYLGSLADQYGGRRAARVSLVIFGLGGLMAAVAPTLGLVLAARFVQGFGTAGLLGLGAYLIGVTREPQQRGQAVVMNSAALTLGSLIAPILGGFLASTGASRVFLIYLVAVPALLITGFIHDEQSAAPRSPLPEQIRLLRADLALRGEQTDALLLLPLSYFAMLLFTSGLVLVPFVLDGVFGIGAIGRGLILSTMSLASTAAAFSIPSIRRRVSVRGILAGVGLINIIGLLGLAWQPGVAAVVTAAVLLGFAVGSAYTVFQLAVVSMGPMSMRGLVVGWWASSVRSGQASGPALAGVLSDLIGLSAAAASLAILPLIFMVGGPSVRRRLARRLR